MSKRLFFRIHDAVLRAHPDYFIQKADCTGRMGLSSFQKMTAALRILAYAIPADGLDENLRMAESTANESL